MDRYSLNTDTYPAELLLAFNKARTVSWRLGVAWTLVSGRGEILTCNGNIFNQHNQQLIEDLQTFRNAKRLYISYCPELNDLYSNILLDAVRLSNLTEMHVCANDNKKKDVIALSSSIAIPAMRWPTDHAQSAQTIGIEWVRSTGRPWVHVICSNSIGGGAYPLEKMSEQLGVIPYVTLKGLESSLLYIQNNHASHFDTLFRMADPQFIRTSEKLIECLSNLSTATVSLVSVVCDPSSFALIIQKSLANEVSYFLSLRSASTGKLSPPAIVEFPKSDQWLINSSEVMGDFMQVVLQKG